MKTSYIAVYFIVCTCIFLSCKEDLGTIGLGVQPEDEFLNTDYFDTTTIFAYSALHDSLNTSGVSINVLGYLDDPVFGKTQAGIYTQFRLSDFTVDFGTNVVVDSLVLTLAYAGYYGDTLNSFRLRVYELDKDLSKSENYYANTASFRPNGVSLTENPNLYITPTPTTRQDTSSSTYYLRVRLDKTFADKFTSKSGSDIYKSDAAFLNYFKGLYLEADNLTGNGCLVSLNMAHSQSRLTIYYRNSDREDLKYSFNMNDSTVHFGTFNHFDYAGAESNLKEQLTGNQASTKEILYAQAGAGIKTVLNFPYLRETFKDKKVVIHRAALVISHKDNDDPMKNYFPPNALHITSPDTAMILGLLHDYYLGSDYFGGRYNQTNKEYAFNITWYIQMLVDGRIDNYSLNLFVSPSATYFSRLMIYGTNPISDRNKRLQLRINYTVIDK